MPIFRSVAFYLSVLGIGLALVLIHRLNAPPPPPQQLRTPAINPYADAIAAAGIIEAIDRNVAIGAPQSGIVIKVWVDVGERVESGDPLFQIDDRELRAQLLVQKANVEVSKANLLRLQDQLRRLESVKDRRAVSEEEVKTRANDVHVSEAQLQAAIAQVEQTKHLIRRLTVRAPKGGIILQNNIRVGEYVSANGAVPAMLLGDLDHLQVRVDIDEQNASRFQPGEPAIAYLKSNTDLKFPLKFDRVELFVIPKKSLTGASEERVDTRVLQVIYRFDPPKNFKVYVGQQVDVFIDHKEDQNP